MRYLTTSLVVSMAISSITQAGVITYVNDNGDEKHYDSVNWEVVRKESCKPKKCKPIVKWKTLPVKTKTIEKVVFKRHVFSVLAGYGPIGLVTKQTGTDTKVFQVEKEYGFVAGLIYTLNITPIVSIGTGYISNKTVIGKFSYGI